MKSLEEVLASIEAFKADMEDLGVDVTIAAAGQLGQVPTPRKSKVVLLAVVTLELKEDLEASI